MILLAINMSIDTLMSSIAIDWIIPVKKFALCILTAADNGNEILSEQASTQFPDCKH